MALLDSIRDGFADRNASLHMLLGMISLARRLEALLPTTGEARRAAPPTPPPAETPGGAPVIYLLLGLISLRRTLLAELEPLRASRRAGSREPGPLLAPLLRDLLR